MNFCILGQCSAAAVCATLTNVPCVVTMSRRTRSRIPVAKPVSDSDSDDDAPEAVSGAVARELATEQVKAERRAAQAYAAH